MKKKNFFSIIPILGLLISGMLTATASGKAMEKVDHSLFDDLLKKNVSNGIVNYKGLKNSEKILDKYLKVLEGVQPDTLSRNEQFAFYINAYNAWTIKLILSGYPGVESIKDLGGLLSSPWKKEIAHINGKIMTLDEIEHSVLRPRFKDPRVHFAVNCASKSCPALRQEAYQGTRLNSQLEDATRKFLADPANNNLDGNELNVSRIFKWFGGDFNQDIIGFFIQYGPDKIQRHLKKNKNKITVNFRDYDWSLNGK